jgi:hypothetical protein
VSREEIKHVPDPADGCLEPDRQAEKKGSLLCLSTIINRFFETSFRIADKPGKAEEAASR